MADEIIIAPANPLWIELFEQEKARITSVLGTRYVAIEHFGSTAVAGLDAKPIIDMLGGVRSIAEADSLLEPLCNLGWDTSPEFNATLTDRRFLLRWSQGIRTHHLHLAVHGASVWQQHLKFRDCLRADPQLKERYQKLKYELTARFQTDRETYSEMKSEFIAAALTEL